MTDTARISLRTDKFRAAYIAMKQLAAKTLRPESEVKLALLVKVYEKTFDATEEVLQKLARKHSNRIGRDDILTPEGVERQQRVYATLLNLKVGPLITREDLPTKADGEDDARNRQAVALLTASLGPFFDHRFTDSQRELAEQDVDDQAREVFDLITEEIKERF